MRGCLSFFTDSKTPPRQIPHNAPELRSRKLSALVARLGESHRMAFFARTVLLVEGPTDEIIINALASRLELSIAGAGCQIVPVTGKGEIPEAAKLFKLAGKRIVVVADLDALADDNSLVNAFSAMEGAHVAANRRSQSSLADMDRPLRTELNQMIVKNGTKIDEIASCHAYLLHKESETSDEVARRRAVLATILSADKEKLSALPHSEDWLALQTRYVSLLDALEEVGCFVLRRGTIEDYFLKPATDLKSSNPEAAAAEASAFIQESEATLRHGYDDVLRALACAAPTCRVDENVFLRSNLASFVASAFQHIRRDMSDEELNMVASSGNVASKNIFRLENVSVQENTRAIRIRIISSLFKRPSFPFVMHFDEPLNAVIERKLPS
jgi:hypothetical protein